MNELIDQAIARITALQGASAVIACIVMLGYALKMISGFKNKYIPLVSFAVGPPLTMILVGWPEPGNMAPNLRWPEAAAWVTSFIQGFLFACIAWISHAKILRRFIDDKIPALNPGRTMDTSTATETVTTPEAQSTVKAETKITTDTTNP